MKAIVHIPKKERGILPFLHRLILPPVSARAVTKDKLSVAVCTLNPTWKLWFPHLIKELSRRYETLLFDESMEQYTNLSKEPNKEDIFFRRLPELLKLCCESATCYPAIICHQPDTRISAVLEALSKYAKAVTVVTDNNLFFDQIAKDAMVFLGLSLNQREPEDITSSDLTLVLRTKDEKKIPGSRIISLCETEVISDAPILWDFSSLSTTEFFSGFPHIRTKHCFLVSETEPIRNLIWKISKKS